MARVKKHPEGAAEHAAAIQHWEPAPRLYKGPLCAAVVQLSRFVMRGLNSVDFEGRDRWDALFEEGARDGRGLLSMSNHTSLFDDPLLISNLGTTRYAEVRWIAADHYNFFRSALLGWIYSAGKCVPIIRGAGLDQPGFHFLEERLKAGEWVHIFPEGGRSRREAGRLQLPFKGGIAQLIAAAEPVIMPFYHVGMHSLLPIGARLPRVGRRVRVLFGEAEVADQAFFQRCLESLPPEEGEVSEGEQRESEGRADRRLRRGILRWCEGRLGALEEQLLSEG